MSVCLLVSGCTPMGAVSLVGSTLSRTIEIEQNKKEREPVNRRIAFTNVNVGVEYMRQGEYEKALVKFNRAKDADPSYSLTYNMLGVLYQLLDDPGQAEDNFKVSLKLEPDNPSALNNYGQFLCKQDRVEEAEQHFLDAATNPFYESPEVAYSNAGSCALLHKDTELALKYFQESLEINPAMPVALSQMATISFDKGDIGTARDYLDRYLDVASHTPKTLWLGIRIERHVKDLDRLASYSLLLRNMYPDTVEAELLRISEDYASNSKKKQADKRVSMNYPVKTLEKTPQENFRVGALTDDNGLLSTLDLSFYPVLLEEKDLLGPD